MVTSTPIFNQKESLIRSKLHLISLSQINWVCQIWKWLSHWVQARIRQMRNIRMMICYRIILFLRVSHFCSRKICRILEVSLTFWTCKAWLIQIESPCWWIMVLINSRILFGRISSVVKCKSHPSSKLMEHRRFPIKILIKWVQFN